MAAVGGHADVCQVEDAQSICPFCKLVEGLRCLLHNAWNITGIPVYIPADSHERLAQERMLMHAAQLRKKLGVTEPSREERYSKRIRNADDSAGPSPGEPQQDIL